MQPELLLLDEPFSNLDADLKGKLRRDIRNIVGKVNTSMLFITHDICDAIDIADEIILLHDGKMGTNSILISQKCAEQPSARNVRKSKTNAAQILILFQILCSNHTLKRLSLKGILF